MQHGRDTPREALPVAGPHWNEVDVGVNAALFETSLAIAGTRKHLGEDPDVDWVALDPALG
ncbi:hypothetical protein [Streptomyces sp. NEAU-YJ-81]|uniref:hypothetical protein n=1 Tax=Streptomyces sp. NEAU-YJ-81 TaxID=2820288 RepID=UPI001ABC907F|nr:hypothetical protein [Streptomyces sp. NEAU-YJ-81]MBO3675096.1 hypothetical protein [Streptomyces sp. NEAU-YJ-81]